MARKPGKMLPEPELSSDEIRATLTLKNHELAEELYDTAKSQNEAEIGRIARIDSKANSLLAASGLSLTVATSVSGILASRRDLEIPSYLGCLYFALAIAGLTSAAFAMVAIKVRGGFGAPNANAVFNREQLEKADDPPECAPDEPDAVKTAFGVGRYRQYMTVHWWEVYVTNRERADEKAHLVEIGQWAFISFLVLLLACQVGLFTVLSHRAGKAAAPAPTATGPGSAGDPKGR